MNPILAYVKMLMIWFFITSYSPEVGLLQASPNVEASIYYVPSDNYLAGMDISLFDVPPLTKWSVLRGEVAPEAVFAYGSYFINLGNGVKSEVEDPSVILDDWQEYADRVLLAAINARNGGDHEREVELMAIADDMWDGECLRDKVYYSYLETDERITCETYKTALYYYMTEDRGALRQILRMQERNPRSNRFGGIYSHYGDDGKPFPWTDVNIETTAVVLLTVSGQ